MKPTGLGRGLSALLPEADRSSDAAPATLLTVPVKDIVPNPQQPRRDFHPDELAELAASIREKGVIQPLVVRRVGAEPKSEALVGRTAVRPTDQTTVHSVHSVHFVHPAFELIAGERRLRAAQMAGYTEVPVRVLEVDSDREMLELSLIENLQREDLNPVETALGYQRLAEEYHLTHEVIAGKVGKDRATVTNALRILTLPEPVVLAVRSGEISVGHAKVILSVQGAARQSALFKKIVQGKLSVRQSEEAAKLMAARLAEATQVVEQVPLTPSPQPRYTAHTERLRRKFGTGVKIVRKGKKGTIRIEFYSDDDLQRLIDLLG